MSTLTPESSLIPKYPGVADTFLSLNPPNATLDLFGNAQLSTSPPLQPAYPNSGNVPSDGVLPTPESCMALKPVTKLLPSSEKPPWLLLELVSATALAMPYGSVAPGKTLPPLAAPTSGLT